MHTSNNGLVLQLTVLLCFCDCISCGTVLCMRTSDGVIKGFAKYTKYSALTSASAHVVNLFPQLFASARLFNKLLWCQWVTKLES